MGLGKMTEIKLVAVDLDGTLLNSESNISPQNSARLRKASDNGARIVFATTRNHYYTIPFCQQLDLSDPIICSNGAQIHASPVGPLWANYLLPIGVARIITQIADRNKWELSTTVGSTIHLRQREGQKLGFWKPNYKIVKNNEDALVDDPIKILVWQPEAIRYFEKLCADEFSDVVQTEIHYKPNGKLSSLGIFHPMANKGNALSRVLEILAIDRKNVMAIGDNTSDIKMFSVAGISVAMENGTEDAKRQADVIAPGNDDNGVAWAFDQYIFG